MSNLPVSFDSWRTTPPSDDSPTCSDCGDTRETHLLMSGDYVCGPCIEQRRCAPRKPQPHYVVDDDCLTRSERRRRDRIEMHDRYGRWEP